MNSREAKEILLFYRPGTEDDRDPEFAEALALSRSDAELGRWLADQVAVRKALSSRFQAIPVPRGLKEQILSERQSHISPPVPVKRRTALLATAAVVCVAAVSILLFHPQKRDTLAEFRGRMAEIALRAYPKMDLETNDLAQIQQFIAHSQAPAYELPKSITKATGTGCAILKWRDHPVSMICFRSGKNSDPTQTSDLFLFVIDRSAVGSAPGSPRFQQLNRLGTMTWSAGDKTYVLGGYGDEAFVRTYF